MTTVHDEHDHDHQAGGAVHPAPSEPTRLGPDEGRLIAGGGLHATLKVAGGEHAITSTFEIKVPPRFDVGAHYHTRGEELFYIVRGELELMAFEPADRTEANWWDWKGANGETVESFGERSLMHIPHGIPHGFRNTTDEEAIMLFQASPDGHEDYFQELIDLISSSDGAPAPQDVIALRARHDVLQISQEAKLA